MRLFLLIAAILLAPSSQRPHPNDDAEPDDVPQPEKVESAKLSAIKTPELTGVYSKDSMELVDEDPVAPGESKVTEEDSVTTEPIKEPDQTSVDQPTAGEDLNAAEAEVAAEPSSEASLPVELNVSEAPTEKPDDSAAAEAGLTEAAPSSDASSLSTEPPADELLAAKSEEPAATEAQSTDAAPSSDESSLATEPTAVDLSAAKSEESPATEAGLTTFEPNVDSSGAELAAEKSESVATESEPNIDTPSPVKLDVSELSTEESVLVEASATVEPSVETTEEPSTTAQPTTPKKKLAKGKKKKPLRASPQDHIKFSRGNVFDVLNQQGKFHASGNVARRSRGGNV